VYYGGQSRIHERRKVGGYDNIEELLTEPKNFIIATVQTPHENLRVVSTHLAWSEKCTERLERIQQARMLCDKLNDAIPTVIGGDCNIHRQSITYRILTTQFNDLGKRITNTLNKNEHPVFRRVPDGLNIDYILGRGVNGTAHVVEKNVSDHLPLVADITIS